MAKKYLWDKRAWVLVVLAAVAILLLILIVLNSEKQTFDIPDKCGRFVNLDSHTIPDQEACRSQCINQCLSKDLSFKQSQFVENPGACNDCMCTCK